MTLDDALKALGDYSPIEPPSGICYLRLNSNDRDYAHFILARAGIDNIPEFAECTMLLSRSVEEAADWLSNRLYDPRAYVLDLMGDENRRRFETADDWIATNFHTLAKLIKGVST